MKVIFEVLGDPMGKQRPRVRKMGKITHTYTPEETTNYETKVQYAYHLATSHYFGKSELEVTIVAFFGLESVHYKKKGINQSGIDKLTGLVNPKKKPDTDNIAKICLDALNGIAYHDDNQVTKLLVLKKYAEQPKVVITIEERGNYANI